MHSNSNTLLLAEILEKIFKCDIFLKMTLTLQKNSKALNWHQEHTIDCIAQVIYACVCVCVCVCVYVFGCVCVSDQLGSKKFPLNGRCMKGARLKRFNVLPWIEFTLMIELHMLLIVTTKIKDWEPMERDKFNKDIYTLLKCSDL